MPNEFPIIDESSSYELTISPEANNNYSSGTFYINVTSTDSVENGSPLSYLISYAIGTHSQQLLDGVPS